MSTNAGDESFINRLEGFNAAQAIAAVANNVSLYRSILQRFASMYAEGMPEKIEGLITANDMETLIREAHTIKGLAGSIGHEDLRAASLALEMACKEAKPIDEIKTTSQFFLASLQKVITTIQNALSDSSAPAQASELSSELKQLLNKLYELLADDDITVLEVFNREVLPVLGKSNPEAGSEIERALASFDFGTAMNVVKHLRG